MGRREPLQYRFMRFGQPLGLAFFLVLATILGGGAVTIPFIAFVGAFAALITQLLVIAILTAHAVVIDASGVTAFTLRGRVSRSWTALTELELVDRRGIAMPKRLLVINSARPPIFVFDSMSGFEDVITELQRRAGMPLMPMPMWKKIAFLQWGA